MKVLLVWPRAETEADWGDDLGAVAEPLALEYLAAGARLDGHEVRILDLRLNPDDLDDALDTFRPDLVGVTAFSMHVLAALAVCKRVKQRDAACWTVAGGHHATFLPEDFFEDQIDFVASGEGVDLFRRLTRALETKDFDALPEIGGLWFRGGTDFVKAGANGNVATGELPAPARDLTAADRHRYFIDWMTPIACVRTTVGCPYKCSFCSLWRLTEGRYYKRDIDKVVDELAGIQEDYVMLIDDEAFLNNRRMVALAGALADAGVHKDFMAYCRSDTLVRNHEALRAWAGVGLRRLLIGIDAISAKDLGEYNKGYNPSQILRCLELAREMGIMVFAQFVVNTDYTHRDFERLARFVEHHRIEYPSFTVLTPLPGTPMLDTFDHIVHRQANGRPNWNLFDTQHAVTETRLPQEEFHRTYRALFKTFSGAYGVHRRNAAVAGRTTRHAHPFHSTARAGAET